MSRTIFCVRSLILRAEKLGRVKFCQPLPMADKLICYIALTGCTPSFVRFSPCVSGTKCW